MDRNETVYLESAEKVLGKKVNKPPKPFVSQEVLQLIDEKRKARKQTRKTEYKRLKREIKKIIRRDKNIWLENECSKVNEANAERKSKELFRHIGKVKNRHKMFIQKQSLKNSKGETLTAMKPVLDR